MGAPAVITIPCFTEIGTGKQFIAPGLIIQRRNFVCNGLVMNESVFPGGTDSLFIQLHSLLIISGNPCNLRAHQGVFVFGNLRDSFSDHMFSCSQCAISRLHITSLLFRICFLIPGRQYQGTEVIVFRNLHKTRHGPEKRCGFAHQFHTFLKIA